MDTACVKLEKMNLPNLLTTLRVLMIPVVIFCMQKGQDSWDWAAAWIFGAASITDYFDGYLARKYKLETIYGKLLDPLADKFLVVCSCVLLQSLGRMNPYIVMILLCRELGITGLRAVASAEGIVIAASSGGKWKTTTQMVAIAFLITPASGKLPLNQIGLALLYLSLGLSLLSALQYVIEFFRSLAEKTRARLAAVAKKKARQAK